jgi:hypothetical protein
MQLASSDLQFLARTKDIFEMTKQHQPASRAQRQNKEERNSALVRQMEKLGRELVKQLIPQLGSTLISRGDLKPAGKSDDEVEQAILDALKAIIDDDRTIFATTIDHRNNLLRRARNSARLDDGHIAVVFYATFIEHHLNGIIEQLCTRRNPPIASTRILRESTLNAKCTWILELLDAPPLGNLWVKRIMELAENRNSFIHYKWRPLPDQIDARQGKYKSLEFAEKIVRHLQKYEDILLHNGFGSRLRKIAAGLPR